VLINPPVRRKVPWEIVVLTSDVKGAGTDSNVFMEVYGTDAVGNELKDRMDFTTAVKSSFERGKVGSMGGCLFRTQRACWPSESLGARVTLA